MKPPAINRLRRCLTALVLLFALPSAVASDLRDGAADLIRQFSEDLTTYQADFVQEVVDDQGRMLERSWGNMSLATPRQLRWHYVGEFEQLIVADGNKVWNHDVDLEQVTVKDQDLAVDDSPLYLLMAPHALDELYSVSLGAAIEDIQLVRLMPRESRADFDWIELGFRQGELAVLMIQDAFGQLTRIQFSQPERNAPLAADLFSFQPPQGVDVLSADELSLQGIE